MNRIERDILNSQESDTSDNLDSLSLHFQDLGKHPSRPELNRRLGAQIFVGQLGLKALSEIANSELLTPIQKESIVQLLEDNSAKFLLTQFNLRLKNKHRSTTGIGEGKSKRYSPEKTARDLEFLRIVGQHHSWILRKLEMVSQSEIKELTEREIQGLIDHQSFLVRQGVEAYKDLIVGNLRLAVSLAKKYQGHGLAFEDLISLGEEGLMLAAAKFEFSQGFQFSTYATWWVKQVIARGIADCSLTIRLPVHLYEKLTKLKKEQKRIAQEQSYEQDLEELASEMDFRRGTSLAAGVRAQRITSLNKPVVIGGTIQGELGDFLPDYDQDVEETIQKFELRQKVRRVLATILTPRERKVLELRFGIGDGKSRTLEEVGREFQVTRERIRQIEVRALAKLRNSSKLLELGQFYGQGLNGKNSAAKAVGLWGGRSFS